MTEQPQGHRNVRSGQAVMETGEKEVRNVRRKLEDDAE
jgi:hypothetical protein